LYAALVSALLYMGVRSSWNLLFVFLVSLAFGVVAARTRSLVGVSISHGLANISFFLIFPLFMAGTAEKFDPPLVVSVPVINTPSHTVQVSPTQTNEPIVPQPLVLIPITGPTATSTQQFEQPAACDSHPNWVVYVTQPEDTLELIGARYGINNVALRDANCFEDGRQLAAGQGLFVPFDQVFSPTPSPQVIFSALNTPTITPTKKPTRKPSASPTDNPVQEVTQTPALPTATRLPPTPPPPELPTLAPTQMPPPPPPPIQEN
jgi:LysM repeat protein